MRSSFSRFASSAFAGQELLDEYLYTIHADGRIGATGLSMN
jgi:hypothetical protein